MAGRQVAGIRRCNVYIGMLHVQQAMCLDCTIQTGSMTGQLLYREDTLGLWHNAAVVSDIVG